MDDIELEPRHIYVSEEYHHDLEELASIVPELQETNNDLAEQLDQAHAAVAGLIETNDHLRSELQLTNKALDKALEHLKVFLPQNCNAASLEVENNAEGTLLISDFL